MYFFVNGDNDVEEGDVIAERWFFLGQFHLSLLSRSEPPLV